MLTKLLFVNLLLLSTLTSIGQVIQSQRLEIPIGNNEDGFSVTPTNNGIVLYRGARTSDGEQLQIVHVDTIFQASWSGLLPVDKNFVLVNQTTSSNFLYFIFFKPNFADRNFHLYQIDLKSGDYTKYVIQNTIPFVPNNLKATDTNVLIGGYFVRVPVVLYFNTKLQKANILPGLFNEAGELNQIKINSDSSFDLIISSRNYIGQKALWIKSYTAQGTLLRNAILNPEQDMNFIFAQTVQTNSNQIVAGVYGKSRSSDYSRGLFVSDVTSPKAPTHYYSFTDLENFFKYMREGKEKKTKERFARKKISGKKIRFQYRFLVHELVPYKDYFILLGEAFYPKYRRDDDLYGGAMVGGNNPQVFDGYQYTHAVIIGVSREGELLWDNSFEMNDIKTFTLKQFVKMDLQNDGIALLYLYDNKIQTKIIKDSTVLEGKTYSPVKMKFIEKNDSEDDSRVDELEYWYNNNFLAYGIQTVPMQTKKGIRKQRVFFINKVRYVI